ncbi:MULTISPECIES: hypothetical protein [unclassified Haloparvum]
MATERTGTTRFGKLLLLLVSAGVQLLLVGIALGMAGGLTLS